MELYDANTNAWLGQATDEQIEASLSEGGTGIITIDQDGCVVPACLAETAVRHQGAVLRRVYAAP